MSRRRKYREIKALRKWRDSVFYEENEGRKKTLTFNYHKVKRTDMSTGGLRMSYCKITLHTGHEFYGKKHIFLSKTIESSVEQVYKYLANELLIKPTKR